MRARPVWSWRLPLLEQEAQSELTLDTREHSTNVTAHLTHARGLFGAVARIERLAGHYIVLLRALVESGPSRRWATLQCWTARSWDRSSNGRRTRSATPDAEPTTPDRTPVKHRPNATALILGEEV